MMNKVILTPKKNEEREREGERDLFVHIYKDITKGERERDV